MKSSLQGSSQRCTLQGSPCIGIKSPLRLILRVWPVSTPHMSSPCMEISGDGQIVRWPSVPLSRSRNESRTPTHDDPRSVTPPVTNTNEHDAIPFPTNHSLGLPEFLDYTLEEDSEKGHFVQYEYALRREMPWNGRWRRYWTIPLLIMDVVEAQSDPLSGRPLVTDDAHQHHSAVTQRRARVVQSTIDSYRRPPPLSPIPAMVGFGNTTSSSDVEVIPIFGLM
jgi:hypothetical protein